MRFSRKRVARIRARSVVLVGTGEANSSIDSYYGLGILRSTDAGNSWTLIRQDSTQTHAFAGIGFSQIAFSSDSPTLVVAAAAGTSQGNLEGLQDPANANVGLYYSGDSGQSWNYATAMNGPSTVQPASATAAVYNAAAQKFFAALRFHGFYSSSDGVHWNRLTNQPGNGLASSACPASPTLQGCPIYRGQIAVVPHRAGPNGLGEMYVWYVDAQDQDQGIWRSIDAGASWTPISDLSITQCGDLIGGCGTENGAYNLTLAAVPDNPDPNANTGTDLYAGAVNLYKCVILGTVSDCSGTASHTFLNLTHVYGCAPNLGSIAKVHPGQHSMDFAPINNGTQVVMYFANDGGIYRSLDGYSGLISGDCGASNQFDSLNQTLGSMTQFVSLEQSPEDPNTLLGGTQGNGSPATAASQITSEWSNVNGGDGGFSAINPDNSSEWFTSNTGVSVQRCPFGIGCHAPDFNNDVIASSSSLMGDASDLYAPYMLDPQNSSELIVGTCRVWRGTSAGGGFVTLTNNFETGTSSTCSGNEVNLIRALAAGGTKDGSGFSNVMYAGTDGTGPLVASSAGGHLWVSTNVAGGGATWQDRTSNINPRHFPISSIAIDATDGSGKTAYAAVMGFHSTHLWQTKDAGQNWTDFSGAAPNNLPDAPVNAVLVDGGTVYVGTDVGVFASSTSAAAWTEVGSISIPDGPQTGFLPNVPVTALLMFNNGTTKLLRAATYGRGVWQFPLSTNPDFAITFPNSSQTIFAGQSAKLDGILSAFNGFNSAVNLNCGAPHPAICTLQPATISPLTSSTPFSLTAGGAVGDYAFGTQAISGGLTRNATVNVHVIDFSLSTPSPASLSVPSGGSSAPAIMQLGFVGSFPINGGVTLSCTAPSGISCNFFPGDFIPASTGITVAGSVTISAAASVSSGSFTVNISATSQDAGTKIINQTLNITVTNSSDYALVLTTPSGPFPVNQPLSIHGAVNGLNGYNNAVQLACSSGGTPPPAACDIEPAAVNASAGGAAFSISVSSNAAGNFSFGLMATGSDASQITHTAPIAVTFYDFQVSSDATSISIPAGQSATYNLSFTPVGVSTFTQSVTYSCGQVPALSSCMFTPSQIQSGSGISAVTLKVSTTATIASLRPASHNSRDLIYALSLPLAGMILLLSKPSVPKKQACRMLFLVLSLSILQPGCGGGLTGGGNGSGTPAEPGTPPGTYTIQLVATEGTGATSIQHSFPLTLKIQ